MDSQCDYALVFLVGLHSFHYSFYCLSFCFYSDDCSRFTSLGREKQGAGKMVQLTMCFTLKHEDVSSVHVCNPISASDWSENSDPRAPWPAGLPELVRFTSMRDLVSKN